MVKNNKNFIETDKTAINTTVRVKILKAKIHSLS